ncbi:MAG: 3-hydroxyacyl-CoA dehydrogenase NAD-binding domain-containing protein [Thermodesulfobacteriota bacterium]
MMQQSATDKPGAIRTLRRPDGVALVILDHPSKLVNTISIPLLREVEAKVEPLLSDPEVKALVLVSAKKDSFVAGADLEVLARTDSAEEIASLSRDGNRLLSRLADSPKPVVAAVHGAALGGGLEVALACHYILASDHPATVLGQAEVMLGLLPAGGGTQRLVRRVGLIQGLPLLLTGKRLQARRAYRLGLVDALTTPGGIAETGARAALALAAGKLSRRKRKRSWPEKLSGLAPVRSFILHKARQQVMAQTRGNYPAPVKILDCVQTGLKRGIAAGLASESAYFGELAVGPVSRNLVRLFQAMNEAKKQTLTEPPREVGRLAVLGGGFMGAGIASVSVGLCPVTVRDLDQAVLARCAREVDTGLAKQRRAGSITKLERDRRWSHLHLTTEPKDLAGADLVIEAVFEDLALKQRVLAECEQIISPQAVFASNTSALPIDQIAAQAAHPERVLGMHYFSPVPKMPLLEIVVPDAAAEWAKATALKFGQRQGKTVILVKDRPGFYTSRILGPYMNEALILLAEGARIETLDRVMKDFGFPVGPMTLLDEVGLDVVAHVSRHLSRAFSQRGVEPNQGLLKMVEAGYQGRKNNRGFYKYPGKGGQKQPNTRVYHYFSQEGRHEFAPADIAERLALLMVNEAALCLQEGVIDSPRTGDLGAILGLGFPPFRGGPFRYLDAAQPDKVVARMEQLMIKCGPRFQPAALLKDYAKSGRSFYA